MGDVGARWIFSFDATCGRCREISTATSKACDRKFEVLPLAHPDVLKWRERSLGPRAPWVPTLLRIRGEEVRAWTGISIAIPLARRLGPRSTIRVLHSLGELSGQRTGRTAAEEQNGAIGRGKFLKLSGGVALATGLILAGFKFSDAEISVPDDATDGTDDTVSTPSFRTEAEFTATACGPLNFSAVNSKKWACIRDSVYKKYGFRVGKNSGSTSKYGFSFTWNYDPRAETLTVTCTDKPSSIGCDTIKDRAQDIVNGC